MSGTLYINVLAEFYAGHYIHVKYDAWGGAQTGESWSDAFLCLQDGIDYARHLQELGSTDPIIIRVARGVYKPKISNLLPKGPRFNNFTLHNNIRIIGSYNAENDSDYTRADLTVSDPTSILSGDFGKYNSYHVMHIDHSQNLNESAVLNGFIIRGGKADGSRNRPSESHGGGIYCEMGNSPLITDCVVEHNYARCGGGIAIGKGLALLGPPDSGLLDHIGIRLDDHEGDWLRDHTYVPGSDPEEIVNTVPYLNRVILRHNVASYAGGGIYLDNIEFADNRFYSIWYFRNQAEYGGGLAGLYCGGFLSDPSQPSIGDALRDHEWEILEDHNYEWLRNHMASPESEEEESTILLPENQDSAYNMVFNHNKALKGGGGIYLLHPGRDENFSNYADLRLYNACLYKNVSDKYGGGIMITGGGIKEKCLLLVRNGAAIGGGFFYESTAIDKQIIDSYGNGATHTGGDTYAVSSTIVGDRIKSLYGHTRGTYHETKGGFLMCMYSDVRLYNSLIQDAYAFQGAVIYSQRSNVALTCCTALDFELKQAKGLTGEGGFIYGIKSVLTVKSSCVRSSKIPATSFIKDKGIKFIVNKTGTTPGLSWPNTEEEHVSIYDNPIYTLVEDDIIPPPYNHVKYNKITFISTISNGSPYAGQGDPGTDILRVTEEPTPLYGYDLNGKPRPIYSAVTIGCYEVDTLPM